MKYNPNNGTILTIRTVIIYNIFSEEKKSQTLTWDGEQASSEGAVEWSETYISPIVCWPLFADEKLPLWTLLPSGVANFTFESGLQPHSTRSTAVP